MQTAPPVETSSGKNLPSYRSHKIVRAAKIKEVALQKDGADLIFVDPELGCLQVFKGYLAKHEPKPGGYFVEYENGYQSWSPGDVFEAGNTLIVEESEVQESESDIPPYQQRVIKERDDLDVKRAALGDFINGSDIFGALPSQEQDRLRRQLASMADYQTVLNERIAGFNEVPMSAEEFEATQSPPSDSTLVTDEPQGEEPDAQESTEQPADDDGEVSAPENSPTPPADNGQEPG